MRITGRRKVFGDQRRVRIGCPPRLDGGGQTPVQLGAIRLQL
jgi:hypothetical protein